MTAPLREQFKNNASSPLDGGIDASQTTLDVDDGSVFPSTGNFRLIIGTELLVCTARSSDTLTVTRGAEGTTGAIHADDAPVTHICTQAGLDRWGKDHTPLWGWSSAPPLGKLVADDGITLLTASDFTWVNQGGASATDQNGTILLRAPTQAGENCRILKRTAPSAPYSYIAAFQLLMLGVGGNQPTMGFGFRESSTGKIHFSSVSVNDAGGVSTPRRSVNKMNSATSFQDYSNGPVPYSLIAPVLWMKIEDNSTNIIFSMGMDGVEWCEVLSISRTNFLAGGPDEIFWMMNNYNNALTEALVRLCHWSRLS